MRKIIFPMLAIIFLLAACNNNKKPVTITSEDGKEKTTIDVSNVTSQTDEMQKKIDELKKIPPLTTDQLKAMLPDQVMGMKRSSFNATSMLGYASADATYKNDNDDKEIRISIIDCAGEAGAGMYSLNYWTRMSMTSENDNGYSKTTDFNGGKAVEQYTKSNDEYQVTYVANDRLLVSVSGMKTGLDAVRDAAKNLNLKTN